MEFKAGTTKALSNERREEKRNKLKQRHKEGKFVKLFKSILQKAFSTIALRNNTARENNDGDLVI